MYMYHEMHCEAVIFVSNYRYFKDFEDVRYSMHCLLVACMFNSFYCILLDIIF